MRRLPILCVLVLLAGCASARYTDNAAEVARDPRCIDKPSNPDQAPAPWCQQKTGVSWGGGSGEKVDFSGKGD